MRAAVYRADGVIGVELNLDVAREYAREGEPFFDE